MLNSKKPIVEINLTPLVDVSLVLVVIFMATAPMFIQSGIIVTSGEKQKQAKTKAEKVETTTKNIIITLESNAIRLNNKKVTIEQLESFLRPMIKQSMSKRVIINPERSVKHGRVVQAMDIAKQAGGDKIVILGKTKN